MIYALPQRTPEIHPHSYIAPSADIIGSVVVGENASVWFNAVLRGDNEFIRIGAGANIQDGSVVHVDPGVPATIGDNVTVGHSVMLHGCSIGDFTLVGIGSRVLNNAVVGRDCLIGAHTLITEGKTFPERSMIIGAPGKVVRQLSDREVENLRGYADLYIKKIALYRQLSLVDAG